MLGVLICVLVAVIAVTCAAGISRRSHAYDFGSMGKALYGKYAFVLGPILNIYMTISVIVNGGNQLATSSALFSGFIGTSNLTGALFLIVCASILAIFGAKFVRNTSSIMTVLLIAVMAILIGIIIYLNQGIWGDLLTSTTPLEGYDVWSGLKASFVLGLYNTTVCMHLCSVQQELKTYRHTIALCICSIVVIYLAFFCSLLMILPYTAEVLNENIPLISIIKNHFGAFAGFGTIMYVVAMILGLVSSAVPMTLSMVARFDRFYPQKSIWANSKVRAVFTGIIFWAVAYAISSLGVKTIVEKLFSLLGYLSLPLVLIPCCIIHPVKWIIEWSKNRNSNSSADI